MIAKGLRASTLVFLNAILLAVSASAQWNSANAYGTSTGYGTVYGSYGLASTMQSMYNVARAQAQRTTQRDALVKKWGSAAVEKAERDAANPKAAVSANKQIVLPPPHVVRNHGLFRPDPALDTGRAMADALGSTPEEKALIKGIYDTTKAAYEQEAAAKGWNNNIAGGLTFFTLTAMMVYQGSGDPGEDAAKGFYQVMDAALDDIPELSTTSNKDKQNYNNLMIGFGGILLAVYIDGQQTKDPAGLASSKKLAGMLIQMVLKTNPDDLRFQDGRIVMN